jgi:peptidyl-prolyl cis-trans isomerase B (cyclophilin B)
MPGEYIAAGKQGSVRMGEVSLTSPLQPNKDLMASGSYRLDHRRAGTVSLNLSQSLDDPSIQQTSAYRNVGFFITTGDTPILHCQF